MDTTISSLGPCRYSSPLRLSNLPGDNISDFISDSVRVRYQVEFGGLDDHPDITFEKAGPRQKIYFEPAKTRAAIVTCGGICPGLNNVIRSVFLELHHNYGIDEVLGLRYGYAGLNAATAKEPLVFDSDYVDRIHEHGGTVLGSSRGPQPPAAMVDYLQSKRINILICVGGDGTLRGAKAIADEAISRKAEIVVVGVPKTIDNDVMYVSRTFGVNTAIARAAEILECAHVESKSAFNGVGLVKVMGRESGFIAAGATLASQEVNFCLIPEQPFLLEGPNGFLKTLERRLASRQHAVVVVAEGAGQDLVTTSGVDKSGNKKLGDIGVFMKERIVAHFKGINMPADVKYFDPSYYIRSVRANSNDAILCDQYARLAVHAAMAGKTNVVIGLVGDSFTHLPISLATSQRKQVNLEGALWRSVIACTGQPFQWS
jgi:6-phosphofructokinase 1